MKRRSLVVLTLLIVASLMAGIGTGAIDVFSANRAAAMKVVNDANALISITGDGLYAKEDNVGRLNLDFTNTEKGGKGFNTRSYTEIKNVFTITNQSEKDVYVWLESPDWPWQANAILEYRIGETDGTVTRGKVTYPNKAEGLNLLSSSTSGWNIKDGVGRYAYVQLKPGEHFSIDIISNTANSVYGNPGLNLSHTVRVKADHSNAPTRP